jgi:hypothetical protein
MKKVHQFKGCLAIRMVATLNGGNDVHHFNLGDGRDAIVEGNAEMGKDADRVPAQGCFTGEFRDIKQVRFAEGVQWHRAKLANSGAMRELMAPANHSHHLIAA